MKKFFIIAAALATLAACSKNEEVLPLPQQSEDNAVTFGVYNSAYATRGVVVADSSFLKGSTPNSIGVFAFYQAADANGNAVCFNTRTFAAPGFMYNQKVTYDQTKKVWSYSPLKYWPNNNNDQLSFFAYAPYESNKSWDDLGVSTNALGSKVIVDFQIADDKTGMKDVLFAEPVLNVGNKSANGTYVVNPATYKDSVCFEFKHILSKVALFVGVEADSAKKQPTKWTDANTTITIDKIEFTNLADTYSYSKDTTKSASAKWVASTSVQDIVLTKANGDFAADSCVIENKAPWCDTAAFHRLLAEEGTPADSSFLFLAPQTFTAGKEQVIITYTVKTTDSVAANNSTITNVIKTDMVNVLSAGFVTGQAYNLNFLIGTNSVKISATVAPWAAATSHQINVPANQ